MNIRMVQLDGKYPNLALMKLAHYHRAKGDYVHLTRRIHPELFEPRYDLVYASAIFNFSAKALSACRREWPEAIVGGTGTTNTLTVEQLLGRDYEYYDYSDYPKFRASIGFTQRGCRMAKSKICEQFCVVPKKEGHPRPLNTIGEIWRGDPWPRKLLLLDNDFFGNPLWRARLQEIREGKFRVCFSQGINTRLINEESAEALATIEYRNGKFSERKLYTAWDNIGDERIFFNGVERLDRAGIPPNKLMAYMLIGCDPEETWPRIWYRFRKMVDCGIEPYPMVFNRNRPDLLCFQRWVVRGLYRKIRWPEYKRATKTAESVDGWREIYLSSRSGSKSGDDSMAKTLYWGDNGIHQFWESEDHELLILSNHGESFWTAHRNHGFLFSCNSALEGADKVGAKLCRDLVWTEQARGKFILTSATNSPSDADSPQAL